MRFTLLSFSFAFTAWTFPMRFTYCANWADSKHRLFHSTLLMIESFTTFTSGKDSVFQRHWARDAVIRLEIKNALIKEVEMKKKVKLKAPLYSMQIGSTIKIAAVINEKAVCIWLDCWTRFCSLCSSALYFIMANSLIYLYWAVIICSCSEWVFIRYDFLPLLLNEKPPLLVQIISQKIAIIYIKIRNEQRYFGLLINVN